MASLDSVRVLLEKQYCRIMLQYCLEVHPIELVKKKHRTALRQAMTDLRETAMDASDFEIENANNLLIRNLERKFDQMQKIQKQYENLIFLRIEEVRDLLLKEWNVKLESEEDVEAWYDEHVGKRRKRIIVAGAVAGAATGAACGVGVAICGGSLETACLAGTVVGLSVSAVVILGLFAYAYYPRLKAKVEKYIAGLEEDHPLRRLSNILAC